MKFCLRDADKSNWESPEKMVKCVIFLAHQDANGVMGTVATDAELCAWGMDYKLKRRLCHGDQNTTGIH